jgi:hypothetical protein
MSADAGRDFSKLEISMYFPTQGDPKRVREQYREAGAHRLIFLLDSPVAGKFESELEALAKAWIN